MKHRPLDDYEMEVARFLAKRLENGNQYVSQGEFPRCSKVGHGKAKEVRDTFYTFGFLVWETTDGGLPGEGRLRILPKVIEYLDNLDHPPQLADRPPCKDFREVVTKKFEKITKWFFSNWWSLIFWIPCVIAPAAYKAIIFFCRSIGWAD